jgi:hypothetical protein
MRFWGLIRRRLQALFPSYGPNVITCAARGPMAGTARSPVRIRSRTRRRSNSWVALFGG